MAQVFFQKGICRFILLLSVCGFSHPLIASDLYQADRYFQQANYQLARKAYLDAANVGSAHAFYQLGLMDYKGLGVPQEPIKALVWFGLAAEQKFNDSETIVQDLMALVPDENKADVAQLVKSLQTQYGVQYITQKYYPVIKTAALNRKIYFAQNGQTEQSASQFYEYIDTLDFDRQQEDAAEQDNMAFDSDESAMLFPRAKTMPVWNRPYSAVADFDVGADGSARNIETSSEIGHFRPALFELAISGGPAPQFAAKKLPFVNRAYLGLAGYSQAKLHKEPYFRFYVALVRKAKKLRQSQSAEDQYSLALMLLTFAWLAENDQELDNVLTRLAESGFPLAQYEYGAKLYRQQLNIPQAIHWLSEASKYGVAKAQYRLARILLDSPWVEKDENKALFWFSAAAENGHKLSGLKVAELKLLAGNNALHDLAGAREYLSKSAESQADNPEFEYLQAMFNYSVPPRNLPLAVKHIREAISLADGFNWDTTEWQSLLTNWTSNGTVTIVEP